MSVTEKPHLLIAYNAPMGEGGIATLADDAVVEEARAVFQAARRLGYPTTVLAVDSLETIRRVWDEIHPEVVFNLCEGYRGDAHHEMHVASVWELLGVAYTGNPPLTLGIAQDKILTKRLFQSCGISTPPYAVYVEIPERRAELAFPVIVKPAKEDASIGITQDAVVEDLSGLQRRVARLLEHFGPPVLVESYIPGRELNVSILADPEPRMVAIGEIDFSAMSPGEYAIAGYEAKWIEDHPLFQKTPARYPALIDPTLGRRLEAIALKVFTLLGGRDYGRVDTRIDPSGQIYVLEFNPNPDISPEAGFAKALEVAGVEFERFVDIVIQNALQRKYYEDPRTPPFRQGADSITLGQNATIYAGRDRGGDGACEFGHRSTWTKGL